MFELRPATDQDYELLWKIQRTCIGPYVDATWGWDEGFQRQFFDSNFDHRKFQILRVSGCDAGFLSFEDRDDHIYLSNVALLPEYQNSGVGGEVVRHMIAEADRLQVPIRLQVLKSNPARQFCERAGFKLCGQSVTHYKMVREHATA